MVLEGRTYPSPAWPPPWLCSALAIACAACRHRLARTCPRARPADPLSSKAHSGGAIPEHVVLSRCCSDGCSTDDDHGVVKLLVALVLATPDPGSARGDAACLGEVVVPACCWYGCPSDPRGEGQDDGGASVG
nr:unnamed protein product [Digitaria exilis]CAB3484661.1 unnamed protein product [Digitaria exilis]